MIYDWEVPHIGGARQGQLTQLWRKVQRDLTDGGPLLVDEKGRALTELRSGGGFHAIADEWNQLLELGADDNGREITIPLDRHDHALDALRFTVDYPIQIVMVPRAKGLKLLWLRIRNAPYDLYFKIRSRLQPSWLEED